MREPIRNVATARETVRNAALVVCVLAIAVLSYFEFIAPQGRMPTWIEIQEGPVAHGVDKFYRNVYMKGDLEVADDLLIHGDTAITGTMGLNEAAGTITTTQTLTPTASFYQLDPSAAITITLGSCSDNRWLVLYNANITYGVTISSANLLPASTVEISQNDTFLGLCNGAAWLKVHVQNN